MNTDSFKGALTAGVLTALITLTCTPAAASASFFEDRPPEGWFWYSVKPVPPEPEPAPEPEPPPALPPTPSTAEAPPKGPAAYSAAWIRENLPRYLDRAIDQPTPKNVLAYMYLQRLTVDKSQRFADAVEVAVKTTPALDENTRRPISALGSQMSLQGANRARDEAMAEISGRVGVWFFYSRDCEYCATQASILKDYQEIHGMPVQAISMDGSPPPEGFLSAIPDEGQADSLGVDSSMAVMLVSPESRKVIPLSHSLLTRPQLMERILLAANQAKWIDEGLYNRTRPMKAEQLMNEGVLSPAPTEESLPISPDQVLEQLSGQISTGVSFP